MLPVSIFKDLDLKSVSDEAVFKTLTSSGTTGQRVSKIYLDAETSANQQRALYRIVSDFVGEKRLPYLVLDSKKVLRDRAMFSARGAGILGFSIFASQTFYALDENMVLDLDGVRRFLDTHGGGPVLLFGFTYMVWKHLVQALEARGERLDIPEESSSTAEGGKSWLGMRSHQQNSKTASGRPLGSGGSMIITAWRSRRGASIWNVPAGTSMPVFGRMLSSAGRAILASVSRGSPVSSKSSPYCPGPIPGTPCSPRIWGCCWGRTTALRAQGQIFQGDGAGAPGRGEGVQRYL